MVLQAAGEGFPMAGKERRPAAAADPGAEMLPAVIWAGGGGGGGEGGRGWKRSN